MFKKQIIYYNHLIFVIVSQREHTLIIVCYIDKSHHNININFDIERKMRWNKTFFFKNAELSKNILKIKLSTKIIINQFNYFWNNLTLDIDNIYIVFIIYLNQISETKNTYRQSCQRLKNDATMSRECLNIAITNSFLIERYKQSRK